MYALYDKHLTEKKTVYIKNKQVCLFGCNNGIIRKFLIEQTAPSQPEPYKWHINLEECYENKFALIIDLKPKQHKDNLSLYELLDVWGYSAYGWTPVLLHLRSLFVDINSQERSIDPDRFDIDHEKKPDFVFEFLYLNGTVKDGKLEGRWTAPPVSATNAALLWPETLKYFLKCIRGIRPEVFEKA